MKGRVGAGGDGRALPLSTLVSLDIPTTGMLHNDLTSSTIEVIKKPVLVALAMHPQRLKESPVSNSILSSEDNNRQISISIDDITLNDLIIRDRTLWATQKQMETLFDLSQSSVSEQIKSFIEVNGADESVYRKFRLTAADGKKYDVGHYSLEVLTYVGYRAHHTERTILFRKLAADIIRQYVMGELRTIERNVYQNVRDCIALSADYDPSSEVCRNYFATIQNKLYFAVTGRTAAEIIAVRANGNYTNMGLQSWDHENIRKSDAVIAKNYLSGEEITALEHLDKVIINGADLVLREIGRGKRVTMQDWCASVDMYIIASRMEVLQSRGTISSEQAKKIATKQYDLFCKRIGSGK